MWNKESIQKLLADNPRAVERAVVAIYKLQTPDEKSSQHTRERNNVGFSRFDAPFLTDIAMKLLRGYTLSPAQLAVSRNKISRYWRQLAEMANASHLPTPAASTPTIQKAEPTGAEVEAMALQDELAEAMESYNHSATMNRLAAKHAYRSKAVIPGSFS